MSSILLSPTMTLLNKHQVSTHIRTVYPEIFDKLNENEWDTVYSLAIEFFRPSRREIDEAYTEGYNEGQHDGYREGRDYGYDDGYADGYDDGYNEGIAANKNV